MKEFVKEFTRKKKKLSVLINNAGMALNFKDLTRKTNNEGNEITMAVNHLGICYFYCQTGNIFGLICMYIMVNDNSSNKELGKMHIMFLQHKHFKLV